jgi:hypothetical protein
VKQILAELMAEKTRDLLRPSAITSVSVLDGDE